jgi:hypothetical protein
LHVVLRAVRASMLGMRVPTHASDQILLTVSLSLYVLRALSAWVSETTLWAHTAGTAGK